MLIKMSKNTQKNKEVKICFVFNLVKGFSFQSHTILPDKQPPTLHLINFLLSFEFRVFWKILISLFFPICLPVYLPTQPYVFISLHGWCNFISIKQTGSIVKVKCECFEHFIVFLFPLYFMRSIILEFEL
jgi:hypothetical protein